MRHPFEVVENIQRNGLKKIMEFEKNHFIRSTISQALGKKIARRWTKLSARTLPTRLPLLLRGALPMATLDESDAGTEAGLQGRVAAPGVRVQLKSQPIPHRRDGLTLEL